MRGSVQAIRQRLLEWHDAHQRDLPWRRRPNDDAPNDPYRILVSEIMLQQTRVAAVIPYYERFLARFPTALALGRARETSVIRAWAGLGYYSRARNLRAAARVIAHDGFPTTYSAALELPGVGPYTAAAVMSIACGQPHAAVDGNVRRVLSRLYASNSAGQTEADTLLDRGRPGDFNQAMMELGAMICLPRGPKCEECPIAHYCEARTRGEVALYPAKNVKRATEDVLIRWAYVVRDGTIVLVPPKPDGLWRGFWTLPELTPRNAELAATIRHAVTFRKITIEVYTGKMSRIPPGVEAIPLARMKTLNLATPVKKFLKAMARP